MREIDAIQIGLYYVELQRQPGRRGRIFTVTGFVCGISSARDSASDEMWTSREVYFYSVSNNSRGPVGLLPQYGSLRPRFWTMSQKTVFLRVQGSTCHMLLHRAEALGARPHWALVMSLVISLRVITHRCLNTLKWVARKSVGNPIWSGASPWMQRLTLRLSVNRLLHWRL